MIATFSPPPRLPRSAPTPGAAEPQAPSAEKVFNPSEESALYWTSTGRSALRPVLLYLRKTGALPDKNAEVLVPRWACLSLYQTLRKVCFPTLQDTPALRGVLVYHQYGFPQRMDIIAQRCRDRGLFIIEDCVNSAFDGPTCGVGEYGIAHIFSLSKMFRTLLGGALVVRDPDLQAFCDAYFSEDERWITRLSYFARWLAEAGPRFLPGSRFQELVYALSDYGRRPLAATLPRLKRELEQGALARRKSNYALLRKEFADTPFFESLEPDVIPYVAPLFGPKPFLERLSQRLAAMGWESGVYHFDVARNVFEPKFIPCVPLPIHQGLSENQMGSLLEVLRSEWRSHHGQR